MATAVLVGALAIADAISPGFVDGLPSVMFAIGAWVGAYDVIMIFRSRT